MFVVGLTGGIASGKSTVSRMLAAMGARIVDADQTAREVVYPGKPAWQDVVARFGHAVLLPDGNLDRMKLGEQIFNDAAAKAELERILHPRIRESMETMLTAHAKNGARVAVLDVPLLFEVGWERRADENWVVFVGEGIQLERLMRRNQLTKAQADSRMKSQMPLAEKVKLADYVIDNSSDLAATEAQVAARWNFILDRREI